MGRPYKASGRFVKDQIGEIIDTLAIGRKRGRQRAARNYTDPAQLMAVVLELLDDMEAAELQARELMEQRIE